MAKRVGQCLLGDAVDHQLDLGAERRQTAFELAQHPHRALALHPQAERDQRVDQPQIVQRLRAQLAGDAADVVEAAVDRIDDLAQRLSLCGQLAGGAFGAQGDGGQRLADLVVQLAGDAQPLGLLGGERTVGAVAPLGLDAVEHRVEGARQRDHLGAHPHPVAHRGALARAHRVDVAHQGRQAAQRGQDDVSNSRLTARVISSPPTSTTSSLTLIGLETVAGLAIRMNTASPKTIVLTVKTRHRIETERPGLAAARSAVCTVFRRAGRVGGADAVS